MPLMPPLVTVMVKAVETASKKLNRDFGEVENLQVSVKGPSNFVTAADKKAEETLHYHLSKARSGWSFLMEESGEVKGEDGKGKFIIDPLDGTNNFLHGIPHWCITVAAEEKGEIVAGVTFDSIRNEMFWAAKGVGAFIGSRKIRVSGRKDMGMALVSTNNPSKGRGGHEQYYKDMEKFTNAVSGVRAYHSTALDLAYVAAGRLDGMFVRQISPWDVAAGVLLVREAGGIVSEVDGGKDPVYGGTILATNGLLYQDIKALLD
ncbi:MAG TPA: inositol monophosphatase family protein [Alphaproteobacteria bacterium]